jgi:hypothetical protein
MAILTGVRWDLGIVLIASLLKPGKLNTSSGIYWPFVLLSLITPFLIHVLISSLGS